MSINQEHSEREKLQREKDQNEIDREKLKAKEERERIRAARKPGFASSMAKGTAKGAATVLKKLILEK